MRKIQFFKILFLICFWVFCAIFITFYDTSVLGFKSEIEGEHYSFLRSLIAVILTCVIGATLLGSLEVLCLSKLLRKKPFGITLLIKTTIYLMFMLFFISMVTLYIYSSEINKPLLSGDVLKLYVDFLFSARVVMVIIYWSIACMSALFILQVSDKFGQGVLISFLLGKYHRPKEEDRIFMFMDLKSSTAYAEKLGHIKYSQFIQDCFFDITDVITTYFMYYISTEFWPEWSDYLKTARAEPNSVEKYMLPIAKAKWDQLDWRKCGENRRRELP